MKALSIRQPWAWAILHAGKRIENRTWRTSYRGPILIHSSKGMTEAEYISACYAIWTVDSSIRIPPLEQLERGGIVGRARIVDCVTSSSSPWFGGPFGFVLADVEPMPFRALRGERLLFEVPDCFGEPCFPSP